MTTPWRNIAVSRLVAGRFWTPDLSLDLMGRDWGRFETHQNFVAARRSSGYASITATATTVQRSTGSASGSFLVRFPDNWEDDETFATFEYKIEIPLFWYINGASTNEAALTFDHDDDLGVGNSDFNGVAGIDYLRLEFNNPSQVGINGVGNRVETVIWRKFKGLPKGIQTYTFLKIKDDAGGSATVNVGIDGLSNPAQDLYENFPGPSGRIVIDT